MIDYDREGLCRVVKIKEIIDHPNADRLEIARINEWQCVIAKNSMKAGDICIYFEIDSILPEEIEGKIFGPDSKIKLKDSRVRTIKIRQAVSQGLVVPISVIFGDNNERHFGVEDDLTKVLKIGKHVPTPKKNSVLNVYGHQTKKSCENPLFDKMRKPAHFKRVGGFDGKVWITEKIHGTSFVAGWVPRPKGGILNYLNRMFFGNYEFCYRSMNVQLQGDNTFFANVARKLGLKKKIDMSATLYGRMCIKYDLMNRLDLDEIVCGEVYGWGIQDNYTYGCEEGEQKLICFGFRINGLEMPPAVACALVEKAGLDFVPVLYIGPMPNDLTKYTEGPSELCPDQKIREGCVINSEDGNPGWHGNALVKNINPEYLLDPDNTEFN